MALDRLIWRKSLSGNLTVKEAYHALCEPLGDTSDEIWSLIWKIKVPQRYRVFLWKVANERVMTNEVRARFGMTNCSTCTLCHIDYETLLHVLRNCSFTKNIWCSFLGLDVWTRFFQIPLKQWMLANFKGGFFGLLGEGWDVKFATIVWWLWKRRNRWIFNKEEISLSVKLDLIKNLWIDLDMAQDRVVMSTFAARRTCITLLLKVGSS